MDNYSFNVLPTEELLDLRLFQCGVERCTPLHSFGPSVRNHYLFHYVVSGHGVLDATAADGTIRHYDLEPGQGFLITPGCINTYSADQLDPWKYVWLEFDGLRAAEYLNEAGLSTAQPIYQPDAEEHTERVQDAMLCIVDHPKASVLRLVGYLCLFLDELIRTSATRQGPRETQMRDFYIQEAVSYMEQNYHRDLTIAEIANMCRLNRSYFSKLFKEKKGCSPQEYLIRLRLAKAADLMRTTKISIGDISASCGYPNQLHFSQVFKQHYGVSPREWRSQNRASEKALRKVKDRGK